MDVEGQEREWADTEGQTGVEWWNLFITFFVKLSLCILLFFGGMYRPYKYKRATVDADTIAVALQVM